MLLSMWFGVISASNKAGVTMEKRIAITSGATGFGAATARMLAARGHHVLINYSRSEEAGTQVLKECIALGADALAVKADMASYSDC